MQYGTALVKEDSTSAKIITKPKNTNQTFIYPLHFHEGLWVLCRQSDCYTEHVLDYAEKELDDPILCRQVTESQVSLDKYDDGCVQSSSTSRWSRNRD